MLYYITCKLMCHYHQSTNYVTFHYFDFLSVILYCINVHVALFSSKLCKGLLAVNVCTLHNFKLKHFEKPKASLL